MALRIEDYGLIGDCHSAALVGRDGSIDWLCLPQFDSRACFSALLGTPENGRWIICPKDEPLRITRRYLGDTLVLETEFQTQTGTVALIDFMPIRQSVPDVVRIIEGRSGTVEMHLELAIRFDYGSIVPWVQRIANGITAIGGPDELRLTTPVELRGENMKTVAEFTVSAGQRIPFTLTYHRSHEPPPRSLDPEQALVETKSWWENWTKKCTYKGDYRDLVLRSLITLKAMTYAPSGGIIAATTTSLPERLSGVRNWDYRYCWLRDATLTLLSLLNAGYVDEARAWREWLLRAVAGSPATLQIMYGIAGERRLNEFELSALGGYENSLPVRVGNSASTQFQLDVYGEVSDALYHARLSGLNSAPAGWALERTLVEFVEQAWQDPDEGLWEVRGPRQHFTHSKVMAWVALDRAIRSAQTFGLEGPIDRWVGVRDAIHKRVCEEGFSTRLNSFVQSLGSDLLDASLLMIPMVGFLSPDDPRVAGTVAAIEHHLCLNGFVLRYDTSKTRDGLPPGEGAFLPCTFWLADNYALLGQMEKAKALFSRLTSLGNDLGLFSEEYDPMAKRLLGNFPQAFTHLSLVNTALNLYHPERSSVSQRRQS
jgi:GH15 family glucan-1,4-alpha-glucosidase